jgi:tRNA nucleotidyltransferase (CCA-adding enzyme)
LKETELFLEAISFSLDGAASASVLSPKTWPFSLDLLPPAAYLVGGSVRDALLGRQAEYLDLDFVLPEAAVYTAKLIANRYQAGFVLLDDERQIARVVFERATVDFAQQVGPSLEEDLYHRDFTVNAIAYNPHTEEILDPLQGYADLQRRQICMVHVDCCGPIGRRRNWSSPSIPRPGRQFNSWPICCNLWRLSGCRPN